MGGDGDNILIGGAGNDYFNSTAESGVGNNLIFGDSPDGDLGGKSPTDLAEPGYGNDSINMAAGNDTVFGGSGDDGFFVVPSSAGHDKIVGGETGEVNGDIISIYSPDGLPAKVVFTGDEAGKITQGDWSATFTEIENVRLRSADDRVEVLTSTHGTVEGNQGYDTLVLPDPLPGEAAPVVTITSEFVSGSMGDVTTKSGTVEFADGAILQFYNFEEILCFTPGTLIDMPRGRVPVEDLAPGDSVLTRDHGVQRLVWTGARDLSTAELAANPKAAPIRISAGALGLNQPARDLTVSPRHRMLISDRRAAIMFGAPEVLITAEDLLGLPGVEQITGNGVRYVHVMCDAHQILRANGAWSESFQPSDSALNGLGEATRAELLALFPSLAKHGTAAAYPVLTGAEARLLFAV